MLNYTDILKEINDIKKCYFIYSYDKSLVNNFVNKVKKKYISEEFKDFNFTNIKFDVNFDIDYFYESCNIIPLMSDKRLVVVDNALFLKNDNQNKGFDEEFRKVIEVLPDYCICIIHYVFEAQDKNKDRLSYFSKIGQVCKIQEFKGEEFYKHVSGIFSNNNILIKPYLIKYFCGLVSEDFFQVEKEILKLKSFIGDKEVQKDDIDCVVVKNFEDNVFVFVNSVLDKNLRRSIKNLKELVFIGKDINILLSILIKQFDNFLDVKIMVDENKTLSEILSETKLNKYVVDRYIKMSSRYSIKDVVYIIDKLLDIDYNLKTSTDSDGLYSLEKVLFELCSKQKN